MLYSLSKWTLSITHTLSILHHYPSSFQISIPWCGVVVQIVKVDIIHYLYIIHSPLSIIIHHRFQVSIPWCGVVVQIVEVDIIHALKKRWLMLKLNLFSRIKRHNHHFFCVMANTRNIILWEGQCG